MHNTFQNNPAQPDPQTLQQRLEEARRQEQQFRETIRRLETQLDECRRETAVGGPEPGWELRPAAKIPFRIDYYHNGEKTPLQGVIEHLPSRRKNAFQGDGLAVIAQFLQQHLPGEMPVSTED